MCNSYQLTHHCFCINENSPLQYLFKHAFSQELKWNPLNINVKGWTGPMIGLEKKLVTERLDMRSINLLFWKDVYFNSLPRHIQISVVRLYYRLGNHY